MSAYMQLYQVVEFIFFFALVVCGEQMLQHSFGEIGGFILSMNFSLTHLQRSHSIGPPSGNVWRNWKRLSRSSRDSARIAQRRSTQRVSPVVHSMRSVFLPLSRRSRVEVHRLAGVHRRPRVCHRDPGPVNPLLRALLPRAQEKSPATKRIRKALSGHWDDVEVKAKAGHGLSTAGSNTTILRRRTLSRLRLSTTELIYPSVTAPMTRRHTSTLPRPLRDLAIFQVALTRQVRYSQALRTRWHVD